jgi:hypothetical protein
MAALFFYSSDFETISALSFSLGRLILSSRFYSSSTFMRDIMENAFAIVGLLLIKCGSADAHLSAKSMYAKTSLNGLHCVHDRLSFNFDFHL